MIYGRLQALYKKVGKRLKNIVIAFDQFIFCVITLGGSQPDETASAAAYVGEQRGKIMGIIFRPVIDTLLFMDPDHCYTSYLSEVNRTQLSKDYDAQSYATLKKSPKGNSP